MEYTIDGELEFDEYLEAHLKAAFVRRFILRSTFIIVAICLVTLTLTGNRTHNDILFIWTLIFGISLIIYALIISPLQFRFRVKRNWDRYPAAHDRKRTTFDQTGMMVVDDVGNPAITKWSRVIKFEETKSTFMLFLSPLLWVVVAKRLLGVEREQEFRAFVHSMLKKHNNSTD